MIDDYARDAQLEVWTFGESGERLVSFDNRRLWVFKHAGVAHVPVGWAAQPNSPRQEDKLTASGGAGERVHPGARRQRDWEFKGLTAQKPDIEDPTIHPLKYAALLVNGRARPAGRRARSRPHRPPP